MPAPRILNSIKQNARPEAREVRAPPAGVFFLYIGYSHAELDERAEIARKDHKEATENGYTSRFCRCGRRDD